MGSAGRDCSEPDCGQSKAIRRMYASATIGARWSVSPCTLNPAVLICLRGFRGVVLVVRIVIVFDLVRWSISRDGSIDLAQDLRPQLLRDRGVDGVDDVIHLHHEVGDAGTAGPGFDERLQP